MRTSLVLSLLLFLSSLSAVEPDFPLTEDSKPRPDVPKGELVKSTYTAKEGSFFPGTEREYTLYLPPGFDKTKPAPFMVFQDGVIYQAPVVFDNLIARKEIPPLVGIFVKPGVVPAANDNALPRYNRSYEYDSVTDTYARFLIEELLPALEQKHGLKLSTDPNDAAISGNSSGGIAAFMVAWHRPDRFRRVFTGVGTYVGIHGADQLPVLVRKVEPKPLKVFLQSGTNDNNLYCGDWWMANQMMERSLTWAGYDVNHAWGEGGHNQKHASQIFPDALRWLWKGWPEAKEVKANARGESKWKGYEVVADAEKWQQIRMPDTGSPSLPQKAALPWVNPAHLAPAADGSVFWATEQGGRVVIIKPGRNGEIFSTKFNPAGAIYDIGVLHDGELGVLYNDADGFEGLGTVEKDAAPARRPLDIWGHNFCAANSSTVVATHTRMVDSNSPVGFDLFESGRGEGKLLPVELGTMGIPTDLALSPDQTHVYAVDSWGRHVWSCQIRPDDALMYPQRFFELERPVSDFTQAGASGLCVDTEGRLYVATSLGIQVCDQAGRVNFIIPTPQQPYDVCFGGKDLGELFIACGDKIYKRPTKVHGIVSGQMPPIKPAAPKL